MASKKGEFMAVFMLFPAALPHYYPQSAFPPFAAILALLSDKAFPGFAACSQNKKRSVSWRPGMHECASLNLLHDMSRSSLFGVFILSKSVRQDYLIFKSLTPFREMGFDSTRLEKTFFSRSNT